MMAGDTSLPVKPGQEVTWTFESLDETNEVSVTREDADTCSFMVLETKGSAYEVPEISDDFLDIDLEKYEYLRSVSPSISNEELLQTLYGWEDPIDYSQLTLVEKYDYDGNLFEYYYTNLSEEPLGWKVNIFANDGGIGYLYFYPDELPSDGQKLIQIHRHGSLENNTIDSVLVNNQHKGFRSQFSFSEEGDFYLERLSQQKDELREGLNASSRDNGATRIYEIYDKGQRMSYHLYQDGHLSTEHFFKYEGEEVFKYAIDYYDDGIVRSEHNSNNNGWHGIQKTYFRNGALNKEFTCIDGERDGEQTEYNDEGKLVLTKHWKMGELIETIVAH